MASNVFLVRNGETLWCAQRRLLGRRDIGLSAAGEAQAERAVAALGDLEINEIISSPLIRASETAAVFAKRAGIELARDPRLTDIDVGKWEGSPLDDVWASDEFQRFLSEERENFPGGERLEAVRQRVVASVEQALTDNPLPSNIVVVSHSAPIRIVLAHYLGMPIGQFHRFRISPCAFCVIRFEVGVRRTRVLAVNWAGPLEAVLAAVKIASS